MGKWIRRVAWLLVIGLIAVAVWRIHTFLDRPPRVDVAAVRNDDVTRVLALTGKIRAQQRNLLVPLVGQRLIELAREEGEPVRAGEVLARLDAREAEATLAQRHADLAREQKVFDQARRDLDRARQLANDGVLATTAVEEARLAVDSSEQRRARLRQEIRQQQAQLDDYVLRSPLDGYVLERPVDYGQVVQPGEVIYEIATSEQPIIEAEVDERYLAELRLGMPAKVSPLSGRAQLYPATISYIGRRIDRLSGAAVVRLRGDLPDLPVGMSLDVNLIIEEHPQALVVPRSAVAGSGAETWVLKVSDGRTVRQVVEVIDWPAESLVVVDGLALAELVVLEPKTVAAGSEVRIRRVDGDEP